MTLRHRCAAVASSAAIAVSALTMSTSAAFAQSNSPENQQPLGNRALASVLLSDGNTFDKNSYDYDIVTEATLAVLAAKPDSAVKVLTQGSVPLTAFVPNDRAFRHLVKDLTGNSIRSERAVFDAVGGLGVDMVETVLLYHVIPGATIDSEAAIKSDGTVLTTAQGGTVEVSVKQRHCDENIKLYDADPDERDPRVVGTDINRGNLQIAHVIDSVLRPINL